jgi:two-component system sensor histidine kinase AlgZ
MEARLWRALAWRWPTVWRCADTLGRTPPRLVRGGATAVILGAMTAALHLPAPARLAGRLDWRRALAILAVNVVLWTGLSGLGALTALSDDVRHGLQGSLWLIFLSTCRTSAALACLSFVLYLGLMRWPHWVENARTIAAGYVLILLLCAPLQLLHLLKLYLDADGPGLSWAAIASQVDAIDRYAPLLHWTAVTAVYFAVVAIHIWQRHQARTRAWAQARADALAARLELEKQHSLALRAQLEPHFVFNALNAISAMVHADKRLALAGIQGLSDLLRYALSANEREWVSLGQELDFVGDYLSLQRLRYGARLRVTLDGDSEQVRGCDCPPLLLQPLVENALRHDLDSHEQPSDIRLSFDCRDGQLFIRISNPVHREAVPNPGVGLGLRNITARLRLAYGDAAAIRAGVVGARFEVAISLPSHGQ